MKWISILIWLIFWTAMLYSQNVAPTYEAFKAGLLPAGHSTQGDKELHRPFFINP